MTINDIFSESIKLGASDIHLAAYRRPIVRVDGMLIEIGSMPILSPKEIETLIEAMLNEGQHGRLMQCKDFDLLYEFDTSHRFRVTFFCERGSASLAARIIQPTIPTLQEIGMPMEGFGTVGLREGLVLVTGPTGSGKSTTLASLLQQINLSRTENIVTLEDPIEYIFPLGHSLIRQRQLGVDMPSFRDGLRYVLRQDPDIIMVGEMRDPETIAATITLAETGHLVFSTLHTLNAAQTIHRIIDMFGGDQQNQIRLQLALTLKCIISQRLLPRIGGGRIPAREVLMNTPAVANLIRENKIEHIASVVQTGTSAGMVTMDTSLALLYRHGHIRKEDAQMFMQQASLLDRP
ncbi:MAG: PilT/PilU family type 4a pilus ATPase [Patescibacteria group bacterium]